MHLISFHQVHIPTIPVGDLFPRNCNSPTVLSLSATTTIPRMGELWSGCGILTVILTRGGMVVVAERERTVGELHLGISLPQVWWEYGLGEMR